MTQFITLTKTRMSGRVQR